MIKKSEIQETIGECAGQGMFACSGTELAARIAQMQLNRDRLYPHPVCNFLGAQTTCEPLKTLGLANGECPRSWFNTCPRSG